MSDDLSKLPWLVQHSRRTLRIIRQNVTLSLAVKVLFEVIRKDSAGVPNRAPVSQSSQWLKNQPGRGVARRV